MSLVSSGKEHDIFGPIWTQSRPWQGRGSGGKRGRGGRLLGVVRRDEVIDENSGRFTTPSNLPNVLVSFPFTG